MAKPRSRPKRIGLRPHFNLMDAITILRELKRAWQHALPGHEATERDAVLRELQRLLQIQPAAREMASR